MTKFIEDNQKNIFSSIFNLSNQAIYLMDSDGKILIANDNALNNLGYTLDEIKELYVWDVDAIVDTKEKYLEKLESFDEISFLPDNIIESKHKRKNGDIFSVEIVSEFTIIDNKQYLISYVKDITDRLKNNEDVKFYFDLINSSQDMIFLVEHENKIIEFANETACKKLGYSLTEIKSMDITDFRKPFKDLDNIEIPEVFKKIEDVNSMRTFGIYITKDGNKIPVETSLHKKEYLGKDFIIAVSRDISERLKVEREKEYLNKKLENYNKTLKNEIASAKEELLEYENMMKRQSRMAAMGEMLENIAHQWRQPLSFISVLSTGMILQNDVELLDNKSLVKGLNDINDNVQYLSKTIDDFRDFFKPNKKKSSFNLLTLINNAIKLSITRHGKDDIEFLVNVSDIELYSYENEFLQVILNLIVNSKDELIKKDYKKCILIETFVEDENVIIFVKDNAGGIPINIIDKIFEPYFTTKHNYQGTGIGLYMSQNIIRHMNGSISVSDCTIEYKGISFKGASFKIKIPLIKV